MGYEYGDAQNTAVRVLLYQISKKHNFFDSYYKEKTLQYFNYKCPYTNLDLTTENKPEMDHIIPANKNSCGLHIYGNILIVARKANLAKGNQSIEEFLQNEPQKLYKIQKFMEESGYLEIHKKYCSLLKEINASLYNDVGGLIKNRLNSIKFNLNVDNSIKNAVQTEKKEKRKMTNENKLSKPEIKDILFKNDIDIPNDFTMASKNSTQDNYWANPNVEFLNKNWWLILNDSINKKLHCFMIPKDAIAKSQIKVRNDKPNQIDLQINYNDSLFIDARSKIEFKKWFVKSINY